MAIVIQIVACTLLLLCLSSVPLMDVLWSSRLHPLFIENSLTQKMQVALLSILVLLYAWRSRRWHSQRILSLLMLLFFASMAVREMDSTLDYRLFDGAWQVLVTVLALIAFALLYHQRTNVMNALTDWIHTRSSGLMLAGLITVLLFSRLIGMEDMWQALMRDDYSRSVKNLAEEGTELLGYSLILMAALDHRDPTHRHA